MKLAAIRLTAIANRPSFNGALMLQYVAIGDCARLFTTKVQNLIFAVFPIKHAYTLIDDSQFDRVSIEFVPSLVIARHNFFLTLWNGAKKNPLRCYVRVR